MSNCALPAGSICSVLDYICRDQVEVDQGQFQVRKSLFCQTSLVTSTWNGVRVWLSSCNKGQTSPSVLNWAGLSCKSGLLFMLCMGMWSSVTPEFISGSDSSRLDAPELLTCQEPARRNQAEAEPTSGRWRTAFLVTEGVTSAVLCRGQAYPSVLSTGSSRRTCSWWRDVPNLCLVSSILARSSAELMSVSSGWDSNATAHEYSVK